MPLSDLQPDCPVRVVAIVRPVRVDAVMEQLHAHVAVRHVVVEAVRGYGRQKTHLEMYEEGPLQSGFVPKVRLQFVVRAEEVASVVESVRDGARTGRIGDGKLFVHAIDTA
jgi:nitrogen regulatory protein PII